MADGAAWTNRRNGLGDGGTGAWCDMAQRVHQAVGSGETGRGGLWRGWDVDDTGTGMGLGGGDVWDEHKDGKVLSRFARLWTE